jgi:hypothetical protein
MTRGRLSLLTASLSATALVAVLGAWFVMPALTHHRMIGRLKAGERDGLNYVARRAGERPRVLDDALAVMRQADDETFSAIAGALHHGGQWRHPPIAIDVWLRWLNLLARDADPEARILATQHLTELDRDDPHPMLRRLIEDDNDEVRYNAMVAAAQLGDRPLLDIAVEDGNETIAMEAAMFLALLDPPIDTAAMFGPPPPLDPDNRLMRLERMAVDEADIDITADFNDTQRLAALAVTRDPRVADLRGLFESPFPFVRDWACVIAADRLNGDMCESLAGELLTSFNDHAKRSGAILAGLTGGQRDLLATRTQAEDIWAVQQVMKLGLWMQEQIELDPVPLLDHDDVPACTVMLAMLHANRDRALDVILSPRTDEATFSAASLNLPSTEAGETVSLTQLLVRYRWWPVLRRFLPDVAPPLWLWADPMTQRRQMRLLRDWWLIQRAN